MHPKCRGLGGAVRSLLLCCYPFVLASVCSSPIEARNVIIFVADGLRPGSVNAADTPALAAVRDKGVSFVNSHALYPTFTMPNASAIATGHMLGDTGVFGNVLYTGFPVFDTGSFSGVAKGPVTPFIENDQVLGDLDAHLRGNFLGQDSLLALARTSGLRTAVVGKLGPVLLQDVTQGNPLGGTVPTPVTIVVDDWTGDPRGLPMSLKDACLGVKAPDRGNGAPPRSPGDNGFPGTCSAAGTAMANVTQQQFFVDTVTKVILPEFQKDGKPFVLLFWSRDPDGTQHNQGDSLNSLKTGINGRTAKMAVQVADRNFKQILSYLETQPKLLADTDIVVTSDHGFSTISRHEVDTAGASSKSFSAKWSYKDAKGAIEVPEGFLPPGFLAIDIADHLKLPLFDPDSQIHGPAGTNAYAPVDWTLEHPTTEKLQHPRLGNGLVGGTGSITAPPDTSVVVAANGGSDLVYVLKGGPERTKEIASFLAQQDYVEAVFVDDQVGPIPGAIPMSEIRLNGSARTLRPSIVVAFKSFPFDPANPLNTAVEIADTTLQEGQGMHGSFGRADTFNFMAAVGPDFKQAFADHAPAGNADLVPTIAKLLHLQLPPGGDLTGRILTETLVGQPDPISSTCGVVRSSPLDNGERVWLHYQEAQGVRYLDEAKRSAQEVKWGAWADDLKCVAKSGTHD
jgi:hypothetical protein